MRKIYQKLFPLLLSALMVVTIHNSFGVNATWTGSVSSDWHTSANWSTSSVPGINDQVLIPAGLATYPVISGLPAECITLVIESTASLSLTGILTVNGYTVVAGNFITSGNAIVNLYGEIIWESGSTSNLSDNTSFYAYDNWTFNAGSLNVMEHGSVYFEGNGDSWIKSYESGCSFNNCTNHKIPPASINISSASTEDLHFHGVFLNQMGRILNDYSPKIFRVEGGLSCDSGFLHCYDGGFLVSGDPLYEFKPANGSFFNQLFVDLGGYDWNILDSYTDTLVVKNSMTIYSGGVNVNYMNLSVGLNFVDIGYGLNLLNSSIVFNGDYPEQVVQGGSFYKMVVNKPLGGNVFFTTDSVFCENYDWVAGGIVLNDGRLHINQLIDNGLAGSYTVNTGLLDITNFTGSANLLGNVTINNGILRIYADQDTAYWPAANNCSFTMLDGILEFSGNSLNLTNYPGYIFNWTILGGKIKVSNHLIGNNPLFHPNQGTFEFHISGRANITSTPGFAFHNLSIAKCPTDTVFALDNLHVNGNFTLTGGLFSAPDSIHIKGSWNNLSGLTSFIPHNGAVIFTGANDAQLLSDEIFHDVLISKSLADTARLYLANDKTMMVSGNLLILQGSLNMRINTNINLSGNLFIAQQAGLISYSYADNNLFVGGNWTNANTTPYNNYKGFKSCSLVVFNGSGNQSLTSAFGKEDFINLLVTKPGGVLQVNDNLDVTNLSVLSGSWYNNQPGLTFSLAGNFLTGTNAFWNVSDNPAIMDFVGQIDQTISFHSTGFLSGFLRINKFIPEIPTGNGNGRVSLLTNLPCPMGMLIINTGSFDLNGHEASFGSGVLLTTTAASLEVDTGAVLKLGPAGLLSQTGKIIMKGEEGNESVITHLGNGYYHFLIEQGFISAYHAIFEYMDTLGIGIGEGTGIHVLNSFRNCTFRNGEAGGALLSLTDQSMIAQYVHFPENTWGSAYNVAKYGTYGIASFVGYTGPFSGESFDFDPANKVNWLGNIVVFASAAPQVIYTGDSSQLNAIIAGGAPPYTIAWSPSTGLSSSTVSNPMASPPVTTTYTVSITDNNGFTDTDTVTVFVESPPGAEIIGNLYYLSTATQPLDSVLVILLLNNVPVYTALTNLSGYYSFPFVQSGTYTLGCLSTIPWGGVNSADALIILKHYVGMLTLSGLLFEAADVNNSGNINTMDALLVAKRFTGNIITFPVGNWVYNYPATLTVGIENIVLNFRGICYGDVNMSYGILYKTEPCFEIMEGQEEIFSMDNWIDLPLCINTSATIGSVSMVLEYPADQVQIKSIVMNNGEVPVFKTEDGILRLAWYNPEPINVKSGDQLMKIHLYLLNHLDKELFRLLPGSELTDPDARELTGITLQYPKIKGENTTSTNTCTIYPNPICDRFVFNFNFDTESGVDVSIYNSAGALVTKYAFAGARQSEYLIHRNADKMPPGIYECVFTVQPDNGGKTRIEIITFIVAADSR